MSTGVETIDRHFLDEVRSVMDLAMDADPSVRDEAIGQIALLLEMNVRPALPANDPYFYESNLSPILRARPLREEEEQFIVHRLSEILRQARLKNESFGAVGILWALSRANPWNAAAQVAGFLIEFGESASELEILQALYALRLFLELDQEHSRFKEFRETLAAHDPRPQLATIERRSWDDSSTSREARKAIQDLNFMLDSQSPSI